MQTILINASAAKTGGAETILRTFVEELKKVTSFEFIVLSPLKFEIECNHISFKKVQTNGFKTVWFSTIGIRHYIKKYRPIKVISFNNLNYIFSPKLGITYFHQAKALEKNYTSNKIKIYNFFINRYLKQNNFVVQSEYIREKFIKNYKFDPHKVISCWPGFTIPKSKSISTVELNKSYEFKGLLPFAYAAQHRNIGLLEDLIGFFEENSILVTTLLEESSFEFLSMSDSLQSIGAITRPQMFWLYNEVDFLIFPSKDETVGLPIFEFLQTGKPAFVYAADYAKKLYDQFDQPKNFILFKDKADFKNLFLQHINSTDNNQNDYSNGEWQKIIDLL